LVYQLSLDEDYRRDHGVATGCDNSTDGFPASLEVTDFMFFCLVSENKMPSLANDNEYEYNNEFTFTLYLKSHISFG
jgi:hypothetical protein